MPDDRFQHTPDGVLDWGPGQSAPKDDQPPASYITKGTRTSIARADAELPISDLERELSKEFDEVPEPFVQAVSDRDKYPFVAPKPEELQGYIDAAIQTSPVDPRAVIRYNGESMAIEDVPSSEIRASLGYGHYGPFSRPVIKRTDGKSWPYTPNMCLLAGNIRGVWVDPQHLACPGCGLDMT